MRVYVDDGFVKHIIIDKSSENLIEEVVNSSEYLKPYVKRCTGKEAKDYNIAFVVKGELSGAVFLYDKVYVNNETTYIRVRLPRNQSSYSKYDDAYSLGACMMHDRGAKQDKIVNMGTLLKLLKLSYKYSSLIEDIIHQVLPICKQNEIDIPIDNCLLGKIGSRCDYYEIDAESDYGIVLIGNGKAGAIHPISNEIFATSSSTEVSTSILDAKVYRGPICPEALVTKVIYENRQHVRYIDIDDSYELMAYALKKLDEAEESKTEARTEKVEEPKIAVIEKERKSMFERMMDNYVPKRVNKGEVAIGMNGEVAIRRVKTGDYVYYDAVENKIVNLMDFAFGADMADKVMMLMPTNAVAVGDVIYENGRYIAIKAVHMDKNVINGVALENGAGVRIVGEDNIVFGKKVYFKLVNMMNGNNNCNNGNGNNFNGINPMMLMLMDNKGGAGSNEMFKNIMLMNMMNGNNGNGNGFNFNNINPMMLMLMGDNGEAGSNDMFKNIMLMNMMSGNGMNMGNMNMNNMSMGINGDGVKVEIDEPEE